MDIRSPELAVAIDAARRAGAVLRTHHDRGAAEARWKDDASPVTEADLAANQAVLTVLRAAFPDDGLLSEETEDDGSRLRAPRVWIVDPLDGTRDFLARTGDFAVHVGLAVAGEVVLGAVHLPMQDATYFATRGAGAFCARGGITTQLRVSAEADPGRFRIGLSRQNVPANVQRFLDQAGSQLNLQRIGASVKLMALARGDLDLALWLHGAEKLWDACAPEIIVREAGGAFTDVDGHALRYDSASVRLGRGMVASNGACHERVLDWVKPFFVA